MFMRAYYLLIAPGQRSSVHYIVPGGQFHCCPETPPLHKALAFLAEQTALVNPLRQRLNVILHSGRQKKRLDNFPPYLFLELLHAHPDIVHKWINLKRPFKPPHCSLTLAQL